MQARDLHQESGCAFVFCTSCWVGLDRGGSGFVTFNDGTPNMRQLNEQEHSRKLNANVLAAVTADVTGKSAEGG